MALADFAGPVVTAAAVSGALSYFVTRATARSTVESARIGADVEREKLAHERDAWRASRWAEAASNVIALSERMEIVANVDVVLTIRQQAAQEAQTFLVAVILGLQEDPAANQNVTLLLEALHRRDLERAGAIWDGLRTTILSGVLC